jgi:hypothetical protein
VGVDTLRVYDARRRRSIHICQPKENVWWGRYLPDLGTRLGSTGRNVVHQLPEHMQVELAMFRKAIVNEVVSVKGLKL